MKLETADNATLRHVTIRFVMTFPVGGSLEPSLCLTVFEILALNCIEVYFGHDHDLLGHVMS